MKPIKVLIATPEAIPFAKTGGLADVTGSLPKALNRVGLNTRIIMPLYRHVQEGGFKLKPTGIQVSAQIGFRGNIGKYRGKYRDTSHILLGLTFYR